MPRAAFSQIVNRSMSEVLMRSLATSFCTLLPILSLLFFGGVPLLVTWCAVHLGPPLRVLRSGDDGARLAAAAMADVAGGAKPTVKHRFYHVPASNTAVGHLILENN